MDRLKKVLSGLKEFTPFKFGALITLLCVLLSYQFYHTTDLTADSEDSIGLWRLLHSIHQNTIDFRLRTRGHEKAPEEVVLLTVDEPALEVLGRWPWSRKTVGDVIARLKSYEASVIGFDSIFSEPENTKLLQTLEDLSKQTSGNTKRKLESTASDFNTDLHFSRTIGKYSDGLIMGAYWDNPIYHYNPYQEVCLNTIVMNQDEYLFIESDEKPITVLDKFSTDAPDFIYDYLEKKIETIAEETRDKGILEDLHESQIQSRTLENQKTFCVNWLVRDSIEDKDELEKLWTASKNDLESHLIASSYNDFVSKFKKSFIKNSVFYTGRWWTNTDILNQSTKYTAYFNAVLDSDGTIRRSPLLVRWGELYLPSLALKTVMLHKNYGAMATISIDPLTGQKSVSELAFTDGKTGDIVRTIPVDASGRLIVNFAGPKYSYAHMSAAELFNNKDTLTITRLIDNEEKKVTAPKKDFLKNKIFLFGATAIGIFDLRVTPFSENYPGLETHANVVGNLLTGNYLKSDVNAEEPRMILFIFLMGIFLSFLLARIGAINGLLFSLFVSFSFYLVDRYIFFENGILINITLPFLLLGLVYVGMTFYKYLTEERKKKELKGTFQKYVSPSVVNEILKDPSNIELGGKKDYITVLFSDIRGFTTISESLDPQELSHLLNLYLTPMTHLVFDHKGTLDKYMGDAVMAFFGAPISYKEHASKACDAALEMLEKLDDLNKEFAANNLPTIDIGIGLNTGEMNVGNMGSDIVRSYTVMGDSVNLGSRLEAINKQYGTKIIISEFTKEAIGENYETRELDLVRVKGKTEPVKIYELLSKKTNRTAVKAFESGYTSYHEMQFEIALQHFESALESNPDDGPSKLYLERTTAFIQNPPPKDWDGVFEMKTK